jgi:hypothetical protein
MRLTITGFLLPTLAMAAILPDSIGPYRRTSTAAPAVADRPLWDEYGLKESETATYTNGADTFTVIAHRLQDSTAALAVFEWQRPPKAYASKAATLAAETEDAMLVAYGNYVVAFQGRKPSSIELESVLQSLVSVDTTALPTLSSYLPSQDLVPNSERYIIGPAGLERFVPGIPPSVAAFRYGTEAQAAAFQSPKGEHRLTIFNYPTHQIAMERAPEFEKLPGAVVKRSGPLVAVLLSPPDPDFAERLLAGIRFQAAVTRDEYVPTQRDNIGNLVVNAFLLIGILLAFSLVAGLAVGGVRTALRRGPAGQDGDPMIMLHLERR